jgi:hypothetical protein
LGEIAQHATLTGREWRCHLQSVRQVRNRFLNAFVTIGHLASYEAGRYPASRVTLNARSETGMHGLRV